MELYALIMAGGIGARFWPRSREKNPKQLLNVLGQYTMIQNTVKRLDGFIDNSNIYLITREYHRDELMKQLPQIPEENIISEPFGRNTAACIMTASLFIKKRNPEAVTVVMPADHIIEGRDNFHKTLRTAADFAYTSKGLVTIGLQPVRPETGYGYIQIDGEEMEKDIYKVQTFAEKPNYATAVRFIESGDFLWNSGIFVWRVDAIMHELQIHLYDLYNLLSPLENALEEPDFQEKLFDAYGQIKGISIDYGVMENSRNVYLTKGDFFWNDLSCWEEVYRFSDKDDNGNVKIGEVYEEMSHDNYIFSPNSMTAAIGVENMIIVNTRDALLICRRDLAQDVKKIVDHLKHNKKNQFL